MANQGGNKGGDIEAQYVAAAGSMNSDHPNGTHASPIHENPDIRTGQDDVQLTRIARFLSSILTVLVWCFITILLPMFFFFVVLTTGDTNCLSYHPNYYEEDANKKDIFIKMKRNAAIKVKIHRLTILTTIRMGCLVLLWMVINIKVENLRRVTVLGSPLWKWSLLAALFLLFYPILLCLIISISVANIVFSSYGGSNMRHYMESIIEGLVVALYSTSLLLAWLFCVDTTHPRLHRYGTFTLVSLVVWGVLFLLKTLVLVWWRTKLIYIKYKDKILAAGFHLYFNLLLMDQGSGAQNILVNWFNWENYTPQKIVPDSSKSKEIEDRNRRRPNQRKILPIEEYMSIKGARLHNVHGVATYLTDNFELSLTEHDDIPDIVPYLQSKISDWHRYMQPKLKEKITSIRELVEKPLTELLQLETSEETPSYEDFEKWMPKLKEKITFIRKLVEKPLTELLQLETSEETPSYEDFEKWMPKLKEKITFIRELAKKPLTELLQLETSKETPSYEDFEKWMPKLKEKIAFIRELVEKPLTALQQLETSKKTLSYEDFEKWMPKSEEMVAFICNLVEKPLAELLQPETSKETPSYEDFEKWMVDGLRYFYAVGNRIDGAFQVMRILNRVMTTFIVLVTILVWLYMTGLATTKVVVGLASIFLGVSFVFGDACKTFFQGVIFSFVTHPFDVADRCIIDDKELKVKKINILTTTFFGSQSKEIVLYPNSDLAIKRIMLLHEAVADLTDFVEFSLPPQTTSLQIESLQDTIERHMGRGFQSGLYKNSYYVSLMEFGDNIKMRVNFEHVLLSHGENSKHSEPFEIRKQKQRSELVIQLKKFVENMGK